MYNRPNRHRRILPRVAILSAVLAYLPAAFAGEELKLLDLSGLAWVGGDRFLAVSDAKNPDEDDLNRVSLLTIPTSLDGVGFTPVVADYPGGPSSDFESAARILGTGSVLLAESSDDDGPFQRIFLAQVRPDTIRVLDVAEWSSFTEPFNIESTAVARVNDEYTFLWAERNSGQQSTDIKWASLTLDPFGIGPQAGSVEFTLPDYLVNNLGNPLYSRSIVGMDVDRNGYIYTVAAFDPEGTVSDPDNGPFRSAVFQVGRFKNGQVVLKDEPVVMAVLDGLKVESVAVRQDGNGVELFIGTDDENYGGLMRKLPPLDLP